MRSGPSALTRTLTRQAPLPQPQARCLTGRTGCKNQAAARFKAITSAAGRRTLGVGGCAAEGCDHWLQGRRIWELVFINLACAAKQAHRRHTLAIPGQHARANNNHVACKIFLLPTCAVRRAVRGPRCPLRPFFNRVCSDSPACAHMPGHSTRASPGPLQQQCRQQPRAPGTCGLPGSRTMEARQARLPASDESAPRRLRNRPRWLTRHTAAVHAQLRPAPTCTPTCGGATALFSTAVPQSALGQHPKRRAT